MRHPRRWRAIALAALPLGTLLVLVATRQPTQSAGVARGIARVCALVGGAAVAWRAHRAAHALAGLSRGERVLARWRVDAAGWQAFLERERSLRGRDGMRPNELSLAQQVPPGGLEIVVGEDAVAVGTDVHPLPRHGAPEVLEADMLDLGDGGIAALHLRHPPTARRNGSMTPPVHTRLDFPVPRSAWREARRAIGFYALGRPGRPGFFHGPGDGSDPEDVSTCDRCGHRTHVYRSTCPRCGGGMLSRRWARRFGGVLVVLGTVLCAGMAILLLKLSPALAQPGVDHAGVRFGGSPGQALLVWAVLAAVAVFGATVLCAGLFQLATGRRNRRMAWLAATIFSALAVAARLVPGAG